MGYSYAIPQTYTHVIGKCNFVKNNNTGKVLVRHDGTPIILTLGRPRWEVYKLEFGLTYVVLKKKKKEKKA